MRADGILFDKDGTLFDFTASWGGWARDFLGRLSGDNADLADRIAQVIGFDLQTRSFTRDSIAIAKTPDEIAEALLPAIGGGEIASLVELINAEAARAPMIEAVPLPPFLDALRARGLRLGVATNDGEAPARAHLARAGVLERFDFVAGYDSGHGAKPGPGMCLGFAAAMGLDPARIVMVGDSLHDLHAGRAAGMQVVGVLTGLAGEADLVPHADAVLPDIGHLPAWLAG